MTYIRKTFAESGDKVAVPFDDPADGSVSFETGYGAQYSQDPTTTATARRIERTKFNQLMNDITSEVQRYQQNAYPDFITSAENGGSPFSYSKGATVRYSGAVYRSRIDSNTNLPTVTAAWYNLDALRPTLTGKAASYNITTIDNIKTLPVTTGAAAIPITLPPASENVNRELTITKADTGTGTVVISGDSGELLNGLASFTIYGRYSYLKVVSDGTGWIVLDYYIKVVVEPNGDFTAGGALTLVRNNDIVTYASAAQLTHTAGVSASSSAGLVPAVFRPSADMGNAYADTFRSDIQSDGTLRTVYDVSRSNTAIPISGSYVIT